jgi:hypothetical protein
VILINIKDKKLADSDQYGLAPFDASKSLTKLTTWDSPPLEAEVEDIKPLLAHIQRLKSTAGGGLIGMKLMAFFLQRCIQPLQSRASKLWSYSGLTDPSRVSAQDTEKKDINKRVRSLTTLTAQMEILACTAAFFDSTHPLPEVCILELKSVDFPCCFLVLHVVHYVCSLNALCRITNFWFLTLIFPSEGPIDANPAPADSEAPEASEN